MLLGLCDGSLRAWVGRVRRCTTGQGYQEGYPRAVASTNWTPEQMADWLARGLLGTRKSMYTWSVRPDVIPVAVAGSAKAPKLGPGKRGAIHGYHGARKTSAFQCEDLAVAVRGGLDQPGHLEAKLAAAQTDSAVGHTRPGWF